jgi:hypothetical protein
MPASSRSMITGPALPEHPDLAQFDIQPFSVLELCHRNRPVLAVALGRRIIGEAPSEDFGSVRMTAECLPTSTRPKAATTESSPSGACSMQRTKLPQGINEARDQLPFGQGDSSIIVARSPFTVQ